MQEIGRRGRHQQSPAAYYFRTKEKTCSTPCSSRLQGDLHQVIHPPLKPMSQLEEKLTNLIHNTSGSCRRLLTSLASSLQKWNQNPEKSSKYSNWPNPPARVFAGLKKAMKDETSKRPMSGNYLSTSLHCASSRSWPGPMLQHILKFSDREYELFIEKRKRNFPHLSWTQSEKMKRTAFLLGSW